MEIFPAGTTLSCAGLLPPYREDRDVRLIPSDEEGTLLTPDWFASLILVEIHPETATPEGTLAALLPALDHLAAMGVNGVWLTPIYKKGGGNGYGNGGPHTLEPSLTGTEDEAEGWRRVADFVSEAHRRNIRVFLDVISWGTVRSAPLLREHPDWFSGEAWGGAAFDWQNSEFRSWFIGVCVENILKTGADGYRCDCEPMYSGYRVFAEVRARLLASGRKIAVIAEESSERRGTYDCEQDGVTDWIGWSRGQQYAAPRAYFLEGENLVECVKSGRLHGDAASQQAGTAGQNRFYTYCVSSHDYQLSLANGNRLAFGYQAIFAPYLPLWYLGSELGQEQRTRQVIYFVPTDWSLLEGEENRAFCADLTRYIRIRRTFPDLFEAFPLNHREANIAALMCETELPAYARFGDSHAVLVVPRKEEEASSFAVEAHLPELGLPAAGEYRLTDLLNGGSVPFERAGERLRFEAAIPRKNALGVYHLELEKESTH